MKALLDSGGVCYQAQVEGRAETKHEYRGYVSKQTKPYLLLLTYVPATILNYNFLSHSHPESNDRSLQVLTGEGVCREDFMKHLHCHWCLCHLWLQVDGDILIEFS